MVNTTVFRIGWYLFGSLAFLGVTLLFFRPSLGLLVLGFNSLYLGTCLHEVRDPNVGMLFRLGRFLGKLEPGWYLTIPHLWDIVLVPTSWQNHDLHGDMYTSQKTAIDVSARIFYRAKKGQLEKVLLLMPEEMKQQVDALGKAALRGEIGGKDFNSLLTAKGEIEKAILERLRKEFGKYGYEIKDFEIYDFNEKIWSEAERIKAIGKAQGKAAEALARPLKDNYPAAAVTAIGTLSDTAKTIWSSKDKKSSKDKQDSSQEEDKSVSQKLAGAIEKLLGQS